MRIMMKKQGTGAPVQPTQEYADNFITTSDNIGLSTEHNNGVVTDALNFEWTIDRNFHGSAFSIPTRWNGYRAEDLASRTLNNGYSTRKDIGNLMGPGTIYTGTGNLNNAASQGFATWYTDSTGQTPFPVVRDMIVQYIRTSPDQTFEPETWTLGSSRDYESKSVYWAPPANATEVMIDFANVISNACPCSLIVWDNNTQAVHYGIVFGIVNTTSVVNLSGDAINDPQSRTMIVKHKPEFTYILSEHGPTIAGSHYFLYR